jgi:hypothetical protein
MHHWPELFEQRPYDCCDERRAQSVPHDIADKDAGAGLGKREDVKEVTADCGCRKVVVCKRKRVLAGNAESRECWILAGKKGFLDLAGQLNIGLKNGILCFQLSSGCLEGFRSSASASCISFIAVKSLLIPQIPMTFPLESRSGSFVE